MKYNILTWNVRGLNCLQKAYGEEFVEALEGGYSVFAGD
jgi:hypothetical protein